MIRRLHSDESGFTLIELLIASSLMLVVLSATLTSFNGFLDNNRRNNELSDLQDSVRNSMERMTRQLRNLANPTTGTVSTINYADDNKIVFQTTDPTKQWVSYCLNTTTKVIWYQTSASATIPQQNGTACPSTDAGVWGTEVQVGPNITNGSTRQLFTYAGETGVLDPDGNPFDAGAETSLITRVTVNIFVDNDTSRLPNEVNLQSGAYMRNQNQSPTAVFNAFKSGTNYTFDAGRSDDPEGRTLAYFWYRQSGNPSQLPGSTTGSTLQGDLPTCKDTDQSKVIGTTTWTCLGTGVILTFNFNGLTSPQNVWLMTVDPGSLATLSKNNLPGSACPAHNTAGLDLSFCRSVSFP